MRLLCLDTHTEVTSSNETKFQYNFFDQLSISKIFSPVYFFSVSTIQPIVIVPIYISGTGEAGGCGLCFIHF